MRDPGIAKAIEAAGGVSALAKLLNVRPPSIYSWRRVPPLRVLAVERATGVSRHDLRPDLYPPASKRRA